MHVSIQRAFLADCKLIGSDMLGVEHAGSVRPDVLGNVPVSLLRALCSWIGYGNKTRNSTDTCDILRV